MGENIMDEQVWELFAETKRLYGEPLVGASDENIQKLLNHTGCALPKSYLRMLRLFNGRGDKLQSAKGVLQTNGLYDHVQELMPGCLIIGGTGGPDFFGIDIRSKNPEDMPVIMVPTVAVGWDSVTRVWKSFDEFLMAAV
jgi:hypothetical protein